MTAWSKHWRYLGAALLSWSTVATAQSYPTKPVTLLMPFSVGAAADATARTFGQALARAIGQPVVVDNRPGAAGTIAYGLAARAAKDGYRGLIAYSATTACSPALHSDLTWDPVKDFAPVGTFAVSPLVIAVTASLPVDSLGEFVTYLKAHPGEVTYGTSGVGSLAHLAAELFQQKTATNMTHVPFKGSGEVLPALLGGTVQAVLTGPPSVRQQVQAGRLKALAVTSASRDASMPSVPTVGEAGVQGIEAEGWYGVFLPAGTPGEVVARLAAGLKRATEDPEFLDQAKAIGFEVRFLGPEATAVQVAKDVEQCTAIVREAGIKSN